MNSFLVSLTAVGLFAIILVTRPRAIDLIVVGLPIATVTAGLNLSAADLFLPLALGAIFLQTRDRKSLPGKRVSYKWALYVTAGSAALLVGLFVRSLRGLNIDFTYGLQAMIKLWIAAAYFAVFVFYGKKFFTAGDRVVALWVYMSCLASAAGIVGVLLYSRGVDTRLTLDYRATAGFDDPNLFASYLIISIALTFVAHSRQDLRHPYLIAALQTTALVLTGSRAAPPALLVGILFGLIFGRGRAILKRLVPWVAVLLGGIALVVWRFPQFLQLGSFGRVIDASNTVDSDVRVQLWRAAWDMFLANPIFGVGLGQFRSAGPEYADQTFVNIPHNTHLGLLAETGSIGYLFVMAVPLTILWGLVVRAKRSPDPIPTWLLTGAASSLALSWTLNLENSRMLWSFLGISFGYLLAADVREIQKDDSAADSPETTEPSPRHVAIDVLGNLRSH